MEKYSTAGEPTDDNITRHKRCAYWIVKTIDIHLEYVTVIVCHGKISFANAPYFYVCTRIACLLPYSMARIAWSA